MLKSLRKAPGLAHKKVLLRIDTDVDIKDGRIIDNTRLKASIDTLHFLLNHKAKVIIIGHLGRPTDKFEIRNSKFEIKQELSLQPIAQWFAHHLKGIVKKSTLGNFPSFLITENVSLLENIRCFEGEENPELVKGQELAKELKSLGNIFVNDAFAVSHRDHVSVATIATLLPSYAGLHLEKEIEVLGKVLEKPKRPLVVIIGGAKIETKLPMVEKMHHVADYVLVGGEIADQTKVLAKVQHEKLHGKRSILLVADNKDNGFDITDKSVENFIQVINTGATVVWNGPVGMTNHEKEYEEGTRKIGEAIAASRAYTIVGGGDTISFLSQHNLLNKFDFVSTGGGAMLEFLSGKVLPGIKPLLT